LVLYPARNTWSYSLWLHSDEAQMWRKYCRA
jgi:hypothetical protein